MAIIVRKLSLISCSESFEVKLLISRQKRRREHIDPLGSSPHGCRATTLLYGCRKRSLLARVHMQQRWTRRGIGCFAVSGGISLEPDSRFGWCSFWSLSICRWIRLSDRLVSARELKCMWNNQHDFFVGVIWCTLYSEDIYFSFLKFKCAVVLVIKAYCFRDMDIRFSAGEY